MHVRQNNMAFSVSFSPRILCNVGATLLNRSGTVHRKQKHIERFLLLFHNSYIF